MVNYLNIFSTISFALSILCYRFGYNITSIIFLTLVILLSLLSLITHRKESNTKHDAKPKNALKGESFSIDEDTGLVVKAIKHSNDNFVYINDIVSESNLSTSFVNKSLDWLLLNKLVKENKVMRRKSYELTPKGRYIFNSY